MSVTHKRKPFQFRYSVEDKNLSHVSEYKKKKKLELWIANLVSWNNHTDYATSNALRKLFNLKRTVKYSTSDTRFLASLLKKKNI